MKELNDFLMETVSNCSTCKDCAHCFNTYCCYFAYECIRNNFSFFDTKPELDVSSRIYYNDSRK